MKTLVVTGGRSVGQVAAIATLALHCDMIMFGGEIR